MFDQGDPQSHFAPGPLNYIVGAAWIHYILCLQILSIPRSIGSSLLLFSGGWNWPLTFLTVMIFLQRAQGNHISGMLLPSWASLRCIFKHCLLPPTSEQGKCAPGALSAFSVLLRKIWESRYLILHDFNSRKSTWCGQVTLHFHWMEALSLPPLRASWLWTFNEAGQWGTKPSDLVRPSAASALTFECSCFHCELS